MVDVNFVLFPCYAQVLRATRAFAGQQCSVRVGAFVKENARIPVIGAQQACKPEKAGVKVLETITGSRNAGAGIRPTGFLKGLGEDNLGM